MKVLSDERIPIKIWATDIDEETEKQARNLARLPFAFKHIALMPDAHMGYGMPIGGVLATRDVIIPNAVGVDIGCGMMAVKTSLTEIDHGTLVAIRDEIKEVVPVGFRHQKEPQEWDGFCQAPDEFVIRNELQSVKYQLGTLGGGNHFIEIQKGSDGHIWVMIHSGSRNLGKQVADYYHKAAVAMCKKWHSGLPIEDLAFLPIDSREGQEY